MSYIRQISHIRGTSVTHRTICQSTVNDEWCSVECIFLITVSQASETELDINLMHGHFR